MEVTEGQMESVDRLSMRAQALLLKMLVLAPSPADSYPDRTARIRLAPPYDGPVRLA
jgi:hypothetical protein